MPIENNNYMNVDIETPITEQTCQIDTKVAERNFHFANDVLDNLEELVSWRQIRTVLIDYIDNSYIIRNLDFNVS